VDVLKDSTALLVPFGSPLADLTVRKLIPVSHHERKP
jgi:hypothetical protein